MNSNGVDKQFLEKLKEKSDIVQIVSGYIPLTKKGNSHWACCPFHHEKTPSFCINGEGGFYHCFGCGVGGDVIKFVQEYESLDFMGAVRYLAEKAGMEVPESSYDAEKVQNERKRRERLLSLLRETALYYVAVFRSESGSPCREYLAGRGVDEKTAKKFGLGASPDFDSLPSHLQKKGYTREEMLAAGVCAEKNDRLYDALGGRLIVPIINSMGEVIAFGGRLLEKKPQFAKYKNTQESDIFQKRKTLYNINLVKKEKNENGLPYAVMVEGYMDVISLYAAGFHNAVASMGTSLTLDQARLIKRYTDTVVISYDGDSAGQNASLRGLEILENEGLKVKVAVLPDELDPDDLIQKRGAEAYRKCLEEAMPLIDYKLYSCKNRYDLSTADGRRDYLGEAMKIVRSCKENYLQEELLKRLRDETGISYESLSRDVAEGQPAPHKEVAVEVPPERTGDATLSALRFVLYALLSDKRYTAGTDLAEFSHLSGVYGRIVEYLSEKKQKGEQPNPSMIYEYAEENEQEEVNAILAESERENADYLTNKKYYEDCLASVKKARIKEEIEILKKTFKEETDNGKRKELALLLQKKTIQMKNLR